jgi:hypothetical protein
MLVDDFQQSLEGVSSYITAKILKKGHIIRWQECTNGLERHQLDC